MRIDLNRAGARGLKFVWQANALGDKRGASIDTLQHPGESSRVDDIGLDRVDRYAQGRRFIYIDPARSGIAGSPDPTITGEENSLVMFGVNRNSPSTEAQKVVRKAVRSAVDTRKSLAKIGAFPNAVATAKCGNINGVIDRIDDYTGDVDGARSEKAAFPMPAVVKRSIETAARKRACVDERWLLRIEGNAAWRSGRQSLRAAIVPIATAIVSNEQPAVIRREEHVSVVGRIDSEACPFWQRQSFSCLQATLRQFEARRSSSSESFVVAGRSNTPSKLVPAKTDPSSPTLRTRPNPSDIFVLVQVAPSSLLTETPCVAVPAYKRSPAFRQRQDNTDDR